jgi:hypothetical protein
VLQLFARGDGQYRTRRPGCATARARAGHWPARWRDNRRGNGVKMACIEEFRPVSQLGRVVAARSRTASPISQEIDVSLSGEIETVPIPADERTRRCR